MPWHDESEGRARPHGALILMCWAFFLATRLLFGGLDKVYKAYRHIGESAFFLIFLHPVFLAVAPADSVSAFFQYVWFSGNWVVLALAAYLYIRVFYRWFGPLHDYAVEPVGEVGAAAHPIQTNDNQ